MIGCNYLAMTLPVMEGEVIFTGMQGVPMPIGRYLPPLGILGIPVAVTVLTAIICGGNNFNLWGKVLLSYAFIGLNDIGQKLFAAGIHDFEDVFM